MQQWDYLRMQVDVDRIRTMDTQMAELGRQGWELVAVVETRQSWLHIIFKRPRP